MWAENLGLKEFKYEESYSWGGVELDNSYPIYLPTLYTNKFPSSPKTEDKCTMK